MKTLVYALIFTAILHGHAQEVRQFAWREKAMPAGAKLDGNGVLEVANTNSTGRRVELLRVENPAVSAEVYALRGRVKYEGVQGDGFLEMWSVFPPEKTGAPEGRFFSRTMAVSGDIGKITGSSDWREFQLPFNRSGSPAPPKQLEVNLVLPGSGTVYLEPIQLVESPAALSGQAKPWWSDRMAGLLGGTCGAVIGCLGSLLGFLAAKRKAKRFVLGTAYALIGFGCALAVAGLAAVLARQPYAVWFPLVLGAVLLLSIVPSRLRDMRRNYEDQELRRMAALDTGQV
jgi:hypothetical protein